MALITAKSLDEWNTLQLDKWKTLVPNINTNTDSMVNMDAMVISEVAYLLEQDLITQTNNAFLAYATGDELTNLGIDRGIPRKAASVSMGQTTFSRAALATVDYPILSGTLISTIEDSVGAILTFKTTSNGTLYGVLPVPSGLSSTLTSGGSISNGTYNYKITAISGDLTETSASTNLAVVISNGLTTNSNTLSWTPITYAASYNIYLGGFLLGNSTSTGYIDLVGTTASIIIPPVSNNTGKTSVIIPIQSTATGVINNLGAGLITKMIEIPLGIEAVTNATATTLGTNEETDDVYRARLKTDLANNFGKTTVAGYKRTAIAVTGVSNATVLHETGRPANEIAVYITATGTNPIPSAGLITTVQTQMDLDENRAVCDSIIVKAPTVVNIVITMTIISYNTSYTQVTLTNLIKDTLSTYLLGLGVGGVVRVVDIANTIHDLDAVVDFTLAAPNSNTTLTNTQIANIGVVTVNF